MRFIYVSDYFQGLFPVHQDIDAITASSMAIESCSTFQEPKRTSQSYLPTEIIVEILSRLPVKSLLRFRCVSKSWRSLISQPKFARTHLRLASMNADYTHHRLFLSGLAYRGDFKSCSLYSILNEQSDTAVKLDCPLEVSNGPVWIVGCCDGLVCIAASYGKLFIWNPSTRKSKKLPKIPYGGYMGYGFGSDESNDDYKVVVFSGNELVGASGVEIEVQVYTLGTASWRRIEGFPHYRLDNKGKYLNGALHWTTHRESNGTAVIVSIDLGKETHGEILEPDYRDGHWCRSLLDVLNGCLCILCSYCDYADVWVMKDYGSRESWSKLVVIPYGKHPSDCPYLSKPLCILKNGEVLLHNYRHLVRFNPKDGTFSYPVIHNCSAYFRVYPYIESLVSLGTDADRGV